MRPRSGWGLLRRSPVVSAVVANRACERPGMAMVGMQAIPLPRIVPQHDIGTQLAYDAGHFTAHREPAVEFAVDVVEEHDEAGVVATEPPRCVALFELALRGERDHV